MSFLALVGLPGTQRDGSGINLATAAIFTPALMVVGLLLLQGRCTLSSRSATLFRGSLLAAATGFGFVDRSWMLAGLALALIWAALDAAVTVAVSIVLTARYLQTPS